MNGESLAARAAARDAVPSRHERPLASDSVFVEGILEFLDGWAVPDTAPSTGVLSFVKFDFNERVTATLGKEIRLGTQPPELHGMHLCADPKGPVRVFAQNLPTAADHLAALAARQLAPRTMVLYEPAKRVAWVTCGNLPFPGLKLDLSQKDAAWTISKLDQALEHFNINMVEGTPLMTLVMEGDRLRRGGRYRYNEALYFYLRYGLGLDRKVNFDVRMTRTGLGFKPRRGPEERLTTFGRRVADVYPPDEADVLRRRAARWEARQEETGKPPLHLRCICCDDANPCAAAVSKASFTLDHSHLQP